MSPLRHPPTLLRSCRPASTLPPSSSPICFQTRRRPSRPWRAIQLASATLSAPVSARPRYGGACSAREVADALLFREPADDRASSAARAQTIRHRLKLISLWLVLFLLPSLSRTTSSSRPLCCRAPISAAARVPKARRAPFFVSSSARFALSCAFVLANSH